MVALYLATPSKFFVIKIRTFYLGSDVTLGGYFRPKVNKKVFRKTKFALQQLVFEI